MADIIREIKVKGKRPETFSGGLYNNAAAGLSGGGTRGARVGGLYGLAGPGSYTNLARLGAEDDFRMKGVTDATAEDEDEFRMKGVNDATAGGQEAYNAIVAASAAIDTPGEFTKILNDAYVALRTVEDLQLYRSLVWTAEQDARAKLDTLIDAAGNPRDGADQKSINFATDQYNDAVKGSEDFNRRLEDAQAASLEIQQEVSQNVPKDFARAFATQNNKAPLAYTDTFVDKAVDASLSGIGSLAGGLYRGAHAVGSNLPVVGGYVGDAIEGAGEWFQTTPGVIAGSPSGVQGQWGSIPPWMQTSQVNVLGQIPGSATNVGTMTGTILDTLNAVRNGQITLAEAVEKDAAGLAGAMGVSVAVLQTAVFAGKTLQDIATDRDAAAVALAADENEGGITVGGVSLDGNVATEIVEGNTAAKAAEKLLADQQAALAKATEVFDTAGGGAAGTTAVLEALEANGLTVQDLANQTGVSLADLNTFIGANTTVGTDTVVAGGGTDTVVAGGGTDTVVAKGENELTEVNLNEETTLTSGGTEVPGLSEVLALPETPEQIIDQGGMETRSTEKAGLAEINAQYNPALSLAENMAILRGARSKEEDIVDSAIYYGGGMIQNTDMTDEINRLLRGY